jgi:hypothetical protein
MNTITAAAKDLLKRLQKLPEAKRGPEYELALHAAQEAVRLAPRLPAAAIVQLEEANSFESGLQ